jgi:hypothetical protein
MTILLSHSVHCKFVVTGSGFPVMFPLEAHIWNVCVPSRVVSFTAINVVLCALNLVRSITSL